MKRRGFTLLEMMTVVAIIGVMASLAIINFRDQIDRARARGTAKSFARTISDARLRAMTMACTIGVQINGPDYFPGSVPTGMIRARNTIIVYRKANCDGSVPNLFFEAGDKIIASQPYDPTGSQLRWSPSVLTGGMSLMTDDAVLITYRSVGGVLRREVLVDEGNSGNFTVAGGAAGQPIEAIVFPKGGGGTQQERASIPDRGPAYVP